MLNAGDLVHLIEIWRSVIDRNPDRSERRRDVCHATVNAAGGPISGHEYWRSQQVNSQVDYRWVVRFRDDLLPSDWIKFQGRKMEIIALKPDWTHRDSIEILCREINA